MTSFNSKYGLFFLIFLFIFDVVTYANSSNNIIQIDKTSTKMSHKISISQNPATGENNANHCLSDKTITGDKKSEYHSSISLTAGSDKNNLPFKVEPNHNMIFTAGNSIKMLPGFHAMSGSHFQAKLSGNHLFDCSDSDSNLRKESTFSQQETHRFQAISYNYNLMQNKPNPFNPTTTINYDIPQSGHVELKIYNVKGQLVKTLVNSTKSAGSHSVVWNGKNDMGEIVSSGIYFYKLITKDEVLTKKMLMMK